MATPGRSARCSSCNWPAWRGCWRRGAGRWRGWSWRRQIERRHEVAHFLTGRDVAHGHRRTGAAFEIEQREAVQEQFAIDHALAQAARRAKADALGERFD